MSLMTLMTLMALMALFALMATISYIIYLTFVKTNKLVLKSYINREGVLLGMQLHLKMVETELLLVPLTTMISLHALIAWISTMAATLMDVCFIE